MQASSDEHRSPYGNLRREAREIIWFVEILVLIKPIHQKIFEKAKPFLRTRKNLIHTRIALHYALKLLQSEKGDEDVVIPAVLLHDVGWKTIPANLHLTAFGPNPTNPKLARVHEVEGAKIDRWFLTPTGKRIAKREILLREHGAEGFKG